MLQKRHIQVSTQSPSPFGATSKKGSHNQKPNILSAKHMATNERVEAIIIGHKTMKL
jgi:hypothetical protein